MAASNAATATTAAADSTSDEAAAKAAKKRYEGLAMVRTKAIKGKGAWYWAHLEPILVTNPDSGLPKAVKLRCSLCAAVFSASNPSRTASEHLKRGTCPNFASAASPISSIPPSSSISASAATATAATSSSHNHRKRGSSSSSAAAAAPPPPISDPSRFTVDLAYPPPLVSSLAITSAASAAEGGCGGVYSHQQHLVLSGGKDDFGALAMLEDSVKRLKSPKASPPPALTKAQVDSAVDFLADWVYECCGAVSFSSLEHPKFKAFLHQVGLPPISKRDFAGARLNTKYEEVKAECEAKIRDAMFFQIAADGWKESDNLVQLSVNLPNGTSLFRRAVFTGAYVHSEFAEEVLWDVVTEICGSNVHQCAGIVSDRFKAKALKNLEDHHPWMVNLSCQYQGFISLIKDFGKELPLFINVRNNCLKLAAFINGNSKIRHSFSKLQLQEYGHASLLCSGYESSSFSSLVEEILSSARALQLVLSEEAYKVLSMEEPVVREVEEMMRSPCFWNELEAVHCLVKTIKTMAQEIETEKPRIGQCLALWEEMRVKVKEWCSKFEIVERGVVEKVVERRFRKNYHPAWAAAFILDPLYLIRDSSGKYLPPFKCLSSEEEKDVEKVITRLVSREEAHVALMELMKWRTEGLDPVYAQAVQLKQRDPNSGKMRVANPQSSRLVWEAHLTEFKSLGKVAVRLIFLHATSSSSSLLSRYKCNWSHSHSRVGMERAHKLMFIAAHSNRDFRGGGGGGGDDNVFALANGEDDELNEVFLDTSSVSV